MLHTLTGKSLWRPFSSLVDILHSCAVIKPAQSAPTFSIYT